MAAPTSNAKLRKLLANGGPSTHGAVADWQLSASAVINGNGKNWVVSRRSRYGFSEAFGDSG